jgi:Protein of unknown function (DUF1064)
MIKLLKHKFKAKVTETDGIKFPSQKEAKRYNSLKTLQNIGEVLFFLRQVPFHLPGGVKYVCDFLIFWANGSVTIEDVKGFKTESYKAKKKMVEAIYPIIISEV